jgi:hypothetical protein
MPALDALEPELSAQQPSPHRLPSSPASRRLELKIARAQTVLAQLAAHDPRARLLQVAVLRRDEILLEALLHRLDSAPWA